MKNYFKGNKPVKVKIDICHDYIHIYSGIYQKPVKIKNSLYENPSGLINAISTFEELNGIKIIGSS